jgi:hypothetical protein
MKFKNRAELNDYIADRTHALEVEFLHELTERNECNIDEIYGRIELQLERETRKILESCELEDP